jgi:mannose-6-phosphate isomerase-like protein (cupin superfamily)
MARPLLRALELPALIKLSVAVALLMLAFSSTAQTPALPATDVSAADIKGFINALPPNAVSDKPIRSVDVGGWRVAVYGVLRPKSIHQEANMHQTRVTEIYYILEGSGTLVTGGTLPEPKPLAGSATTLQSSRIEGGVSRRVSPGDVIIIPGRTPHWFSSQDADLKYLIFRPDPDGKLALK